QAQPVRGFHVERDGLLAPVQPHEMRTHPAYRAVVGAREVAPVDALDLDHSRAEVGEMPGGQRRGDGLFETDDRDPVPRPHRAELFVRHAHLLTTRWLPSYQTSFRCFPDSQARW